jgi:purine-binding chemotaxis protein CheW
MSETRRFCELILAGRRYGVDVARVREVVRGLPLTRVPLAPAHVAGLLNLRGQVLSAMDLRRRLGLPERPADAETTLVVVEAAEGALGLQVDEVGQVLEAYAELFETPPETLDAGARGPVAGAYKLSSGLLLALDLDRVLDGAGT